MIASDEIYSKYTLTSRMACELNEVFLVGHTKFVELHILKCLSPVCKHV